jgi:hypothetical protein
MAKSFITYPMHMPPTRKHLPLATFTSPFTSSAYARLVVPIPMLPLPCCTTNCDPPTANPWPLATVVVPVVLVNAPRPKYPVPLTVNAVELAYGNCEAVVLVATKEAAVGVEVATSLPALSVDSSALVKLGSQRVPSVARDDEELRVVRRPATVEDACDRKPPASVPRVLSESPPAVSEPIVALLLLSVVELAVPEKAVPETVSAVDDAFTKYEVEDATGTRCP